MNKFEVKVDGKVINNIIKNVFVMKIAVNIEHIIPILKVTANLNDKKLHFCNFYTRSTHMNCFI